MNPISDEVGKTARDVIGAFKASPLVFAALLFNIGFMVMLAYMVREGSSRWQDITTKILAVCGPQTGV